MVKGIKKTEIGLIPEDWEVVELGDVVDYIKGYPFKSKDYCSDGVRVIRISDTTYNSIKDWGEIYVSDEIANYTRRWSLNHGDLIVSTVGSKPPMYDSMVGKVIYVQKKYAGSLLNQNAVLFKNKDSNLQILLANIFNTKRYIEFIESIYRGNANQASINLAELFQFKIPLPPLPEQEAIAGALSDADAWIESLEQLIAKKRLIKQGAMQELLTPKEGWEVKTILEIADGKRDLFNDGDWIESEHIVDEGIRLVQTGNIGIGKFLNKANRKYINELSFNKLKCKELREGDLLICRLAEPAGRACLFPKTDDYKSITSVDVTIYRPDVQKYDRRFLLFSLSTDQWFTDVIEQVGGTTHKRISRGNLGRINISVPQLTEQTRIATILSDMDAELEALEQQLHKARQIKQGMMQELLTGRVRLV